MGDPRMYPISSNSGKNPIVIKERRYTLTLTPASVAANLTAEQELTVPGLAVGDVVVGVQTPAWGNATGLCGLRVKTTDKLGATFVNPTAGALVPGAGVWDLLVYTYK